MKKDTKYDSLAIVLLSLLTVALYLNSLDNSFHFDDTPNIVENPYIRNLEDTPTFFKRAAGYTGTFRVLTSLSFAINYHFHQLDVFGYHLVNVILHILSGILVYFLSRNLFILWREKKNVKPKKKTVPEDLRINFLAFLTASVFISHPIQVNTVTYIVQRNEGLASFFYLLCLLLFIKGSLNKGSKKFLFLAGAGLSFLCSIFSKEIGFTLPLVIIMLDLFFICETKKEIQKKIKIYLLLFSAFAIYILFFLKGGMLRFLIKGAWKEPWTPWEYLLTQSNVMIQYFKLLFLPLPHWLNIDHDVQISKSMWEYPTFFFMSIILLLFILAIFLIKKNRLISFCILFFLIVLAPTSSIIPIWDIMVEYRLYLPIFSYGLILSMGLQYLHRILTSCFSKKLGQGMIWGISIFILFSFSLITIERNKIFKDDLTLWSDVVKKSPNKMRGHHNLGKAYILAGQIDQGIQEGKIALRLSAYQLDKKSVKFVLNLLGGAYSEKGENDKAILLFQQAIKVDPNFSPPYYNMSCIYASKKEKEKALEYFRKAISLNPKYKEKAKIEDDFTSLRGEKEFEDLVK